MKHPKLYNSGVVLLERVWHWVPNRVVRLPFSSKLNLVTKGPVPSAPITYDFSRGIPDELGKGIADGQQPLCQKQEEVLTCTNVTTDARKPGKYNFELKAFPRKGSTVPYQTLEVEIAEKPAPEVVSFRLDKNQYTKGDLMRLSWEIKNQDQLSRLKIIGKAEDGTGAELAELEPNKLTQVNANIPKPLCKPVNQVLTCTNVPVTAPQAGKYTFELQAFSKPGKPPNSKPTETKVEILPKPIKIAYFTLNGSEEPNIVLKDGEPVTLSWKVEGEDINVELSTSGNVGPSGSQQLKANLALEPRIELIVTDKFDRRATKAFLIKVVTPPPPSPQVPQSTPSPLFEFSPSKPPSAAPKK
jgi:hypothetical protein